MAFSPTLIAIGAIIIVVVVIGLALSLAAGTTTSSSTTRPSSSTTQTSTVTTTAMAAVPRMTRYMSSTEGVNALANVSITVNASGPDGVVTHVTIPAGTYATSGNELLSTYNFSIVTLDVSNILPPASGQQPEYGWLYEVNGNVGTGYGFAYANGTARHLTTTAMYNQSWTSWAWLGGTWNGTAYVGGNYVAQDAWAYNASTGTLTNTQFSKAIPWVWTHVLSTQASSGAS